MLYLGGGKRLYNSVIVLKNYFFHVYLLLREKRERERERESTGVGQREGEREGDPESEAGSRLQGVSTEPNTGLEFMNC